tara:strand:- start:1095 stop:1358 length:264 start_codon:yes stop_codon:yes gene_type:complete
MSDDESELAGVSEQLAAVVAELRAIRGDLDLLSQSVEGRDGLDVRVVELEAWTKRIGTVAAWVFRCMFGAVLAGLVAKLVTDGFSDG